ncbi:hypothetical protein J1614_008097 [Plenodomus biglobosus]|nr:hypothetical protein J1614_008097 [Plenodomus biglobosus]
MPRDLLADRKTVDGMTELLRDSATSPPPANSSLVPHRESNMMKQERLKKTGIHPFAQLLNIEDLDDCDWLEHAAFDPIEAASREKVAHFHRSSICSTIPPSLRLFCMKPFILHSRHTVGHHQASPLRSSPSLSSPALRTRHNADHRRPRLAYEQPMCQPYCTNIVTLL